jgi:proteasome lid subunit RPN8/RPN11
MDIFISKHQLSYFRKRCRNSKEEIHAYLIGRVLKSRITVDAIVHTYDLALQTAESVQPSDEAYQRAKSIADSLGKVIVGDIHSHPEYEAVMSPADHAAAISDELTVCGIVEVRKRKTKVNFWLANSSLRCEIIYR